MERGELLEDLVALGAELVGFFGFLAGEQNRQTFLDERELAEQRFLAVPLFVGEGPAGAGGEVVEHAAAQKLFIGLPGVARLAVAGLEGGEKSQRRFLGKARPVQAGKTNVRAHGQEDLGRLLRRLFRAREISLRITDPREIVEAMAGSGILFPQDVAEDGQGASHRLRRVHISALERPTRSQVAQGVGDIEVVVRADLVVDGEGLPETFLPLRVSSLKKQGPGQTVLAVRSEEVPLAQGRAANRQGLAV